MEEFLTYLVSRMVTHDDEVTITTEEDSYQTIYNIQVNPEDYGKIIGKKGKTINALRTIFNLYLHKNNLIGEKKIFLKVVDAE